MNTAEFEILSFPTTQAWEGWLEQNHSNIQGIWLRFFKKNASVEAIGYDQALEVALCFGWIDSQVKKYDDFSYLQKFTPRRSQSTWSKINTQHIERLITAGKMKPAGLKQVLEAKRDGRWERAYQSQRFLSLPEDFLEQVKKNKKAYIFFQTLNKANLYAISFRFATARKPEIRTNRMKKILAMLSRNEKFHS